MPFSKAEAGLARLDPKAVILSGGPASVTDAGSPRAPQSIFAKMFGFTEREYFEVEPEARGNVKVQF